MTTGVCCPTCANGISPHKGQPCRDCEIDKMPPGPRKALKVFVRDHVNGTSRQEIGRTRKAPGKEIGQ
jgi:hypothetical protein